MGIQVIKGNSDKEEIKRLQLIINDYAAICKGYQEELNQLRERLAAIDSPVQQEHEERDS